MKGRRYGGVSCTMGDDTLDPTPYLYLRQEEVYYLTHTITCGVAPDRCLKCYHLWKFHSDRGASCAICVCPRYTYQTQEEQRL